MRPSESEIFIDLVRDEPQIVLPAQPGDAGNLVLSEHRPGRIVRAVDPDYPRPRRYREREAVEVGVEVPLGAQRDIDHARTARSDDPGIGTVDRLRQDHLVARS